MDPGFNKGKGGKSAPIYHHALERDLLIYSGVHPTWSDKAIAAKLRSSEWYVRKRKGELSTVLFHLFHIPGFLRRSVQNIHQI